jgi:phytanoyl-CoA hydroxylase
MTRILNRIQQKFYADHGYLIIENFIEPTLCQDLKKEAHQLMDAFQPQTYKTIFNTQNQSHAKHQYFLDSGNHIHFFFEDGAIDARGNLKYEKHLCINKIGHALHTQNPVFRAFSHSQKIQDLCHDLHITNPITMQSMYICKQPFVGGEVTCHQDSTYLYVKENPVVGLWFALEDATQQNGCLWAIPGGHQSPLKSRFIRNTQHETSIEIYDHTPWNLTKMVPLEVTAGSLIVLHGLLPHMSKENTSSQSRHAYSLHVISGDAEYAADNWLQRAE